MEVRNKGLKELREEDNLMSSQRKHENYLAESQKMYSFATEKDVSCI